MQASQYAQSPTLQFGLDRYLRSVPVSCLCVYSDGTISYRKPWNCVFATRTLGPAHNLDSHAVLVIHQCSDSRYSWLKRTANCASDIPSIVPLSHRSVGSIAPPPQLLFYCRQRQLMEISAVPTVSLTLMARQAHTLDWYFTRTARRCSGFDHASAPCEQPPSMKKRTEPALITGWATIPIVSSHSRTPRGMGYLSTIVVMPSHT